MKVIPLNHNLNLTRLSVALCNTATGVHHLAASDVMFKLKGNFPLVCNRINHKKSFVL